jgi:hypothetical protein
VSLNLGSGLGCLKVSRDVILLMDIVIYIMSSPTWDFFTNRFNDARRLGNRLKRKTRRVFDLRIEQQCNAEYVLEAVWFI